MTYPLHSSRTLQVVHGCKGTETCLCFLPVEIRKLGIQEKRWAEQGATAASRLDREVMYAYWLSFEEGLIWRAVEWGGYQECSLCRSTPSRLNTAPRARITGWQISWDNLTVVGRMQPGLRESSFIEESSWRNLAVWLRNCHSPLSNYRVS